MKSKEKVAIQAPPTGKRMSLLLTFVFLFFVQPTLIHFFPASKEKATSLPAIPLPAGTHLVPTFSAGHSEQPISRQHCHRTTRPPRRNESVKCWLFQEAGAILVDAMGGRGGGGGGGDNPWASAPFSVAVRHGDEEFSKIVFGDKPS